GNRHGRYRFVFERPDGERIELTWVHGESLALSRDETFGYMEDALGNRLNANQVRLTGHPIYLRRIAT
ncbi:MAG: hypothetical protein WD558_02460, partial [Pseudomonadales bacterium]